MESKKALKIGWSKKVFSFLISEEYPLKITNKDKLFYGYETIAQLRSQKFAEKDEKFVKKFFIDKIKGIEEDSEKARELKLEALEKAVDKLGYRLVFEEKKVTNYGVPLIPDNKVQMMFTMKAYGLPWEVIAEEMGLDAEEISRYKGRVV